MIKVGLVRGNYLNNFEGQNYIFDDDNIQLTAIASKNAIHKRFPFPTINLLSLMDIYNSVLFSQSVFYQRTVKIITNRVLGDSQLLFNLEQLKNKFDIFHTADPHYYYSYQLARLRADGLIKKLIVTSWDVIPFNNETVYQKKKHKYFVLKQADQFICYTNKAKETLIQEGVQENKIEVVRLGIDLQRFKTTDEKKGTITLLYVGRLIKDKGVLDIYTVFEKLIQKFPYIKLNIIGDGDLKHLLLKKIIRSNLEKKVSIAQADYKDMPLMYQSADILVLPSRKTATQAEQYGMVLVEALASGLAVVAYDVGAIKEVIGNAGMIIKEDVNELYLALKELITDPKKRQYLSQKGRIRAEQNFNSRQTAREIGRIYSRLMGKI